MITFEKVYDNINVAPVTIPDSAYFESDQDSNVLLIDAIAEDVSGGIAKIILQYRNEEYGGYLEQSYSIPMDKGTPFIFPTYGRMGRIKVELSGCNLTLLKTMATNNVAKIFSTGTYITQLSASNGSVSISAVAPLDYTAGELSITPDGINKILGVNSDDSAMEFKTIQGTANQISVTHAAELITLSLPSIIQLTKLGLGTATFGTNNKVLVNPYKVVNNDAINQVTAINTTDIGYVFQWFASGHTGNAFQVENHLGTLLSRITKDGNFEAPNGSSGTPGFKFSTSGNGIWFSAGDGPYYESSNNISLRAANAGVINLYSGGNEIRITNIGDSADFVSLTRDAANIFAIKNAANACMYRVYNTYTNSSNYERARFGWIANVLEIGTANAGTGTARSIKLAPASGLLIFEDCNYQLGTTTGTKWGTAANQKQSWWNATPVVQDTGWTNTNVTTSKTFDADTVTLQELADVVGTLINTLKTYGQLGG